MKAVALAAAFVITSPAMAADVQVVEEATVRVSDLVDLSSWAEVSDAKAFERLASTPVFRLKPGVVSTFSTEGVAAALTKRVPGLADHLDSGLGHEVSFVYHERAAAPRTACLTLRSDLSEGDYIRRYDVVETSDCDNTVSRQALQRNGVAIAAAEDLPRGARLPISSRELLPVSVAGDDLTLVSNVGPVSVTRPVELARPVMKPGPVWVRTSDGDVLSATIDAAHFDELFQTDEAQP